MMVERRDVEFEVEGGDRLRGWLFVPENRSARHPAISMAHGYAGVKEHGLERFARAFTEAGFVVLVHDHRNFGSSDGAIRHDIDPWRQIADWRRAISLLESMDLSGSDLDNVTRAILGEAGPSAMPASMAAVASVIRNRLAAGGYGKSPSEIVRAPNQFEPWNPDSGNDPGRFASSNAAHGSAAILRNSQSASRDDLLVSGSCIPIVGGSIISGP
jgi:fermentation-respiration switch protein FrsA (DUF1100 family)